MRFHSLSKRPRHFQSLTGFTPQEFADLARLMRPEWENQRLKRFKTKRKRMIGGGRKLKIEEFADRLLVFTVYARLYLPYLLIEYLFGIDESSICRIIQEMTPLLSEKIIINRPAKRIRTMEELKELIPDLDEILLDSTEQAIPRPQNKRQRKKYHSGKRKAHTLKTQIITDPKGLILQVADSSPGRIHDYKYFKETPLPLWLQNHPEITLYADRGYQGINSDYPNIKAKIPIKRTRWKTELTLREKIFNTRLSRKRIVIEHTLAQLKKFRILAEKYRNAKEQYSLIFKSVAFFSNFRMLERMTP